MPAASDGRLARGAGQEVFIAKSEGVSRSRPPAHTPLPAGAQLQNPTLPDVCRQQQAGDLKEGRRLQQRRRRRQPGRQEGRRCAAVSGNRASQADLLVFTRLRRAKKMAKKKAAGGKGKAKGGGGGRPQATRQKPLSAWEQAGALDAAIPMWEEMSLEQRQAFLTVDVDELRACAHDDGERQALEAALARARRLPSWRAWHFRCTDDGTFEIFEAGDGFRDADAFLCAAYERLRTSRSPVIRAPQAPETPAEAGLKQRMCVRLGCGGGRPGCGGAGRHCSTQLLMLPPRLPRASPLPTARACCRTTLRPGRGSFRRSRIYATGATTRMRSTSSSSTCARSTRRCPPLCWGRSPTFSSARRALA